jgi:hypothetical protein
MGILTTERRVALHRRALWLEYLTVGWNVLEAVVAIAAGILAASVALIGFGFDSAIEVISAVGLLWRLRKAGPHATVSEESEAEKRTLYVVATTFFLLAAYIAYDAVSALSQREEPLTSPVGIVLSVLALVVMPVLATPSTALVGRWAVARSWPTPRKHGSARICRSRCSSAWAPTHCSGGGGPTLLVRWRCSRSSSGKGGRRWPKRGSQSRPSKHQTDHCRFYGCACLDSRVATSPHGDDMPRSKPTRLQRASSHPETGDPSISNVYPASKRERHGS